MNAIKINMMQGTTLFVYTTFVLPFVGMAVTLSQSVTLTGPISGRVSDVDMIHTNEYNVTVQ